MVFQLANNSSDSATCTTARSIAFIKTILLLCFLSFIAGCMGVHSDPKPNEISQENKQEVQRALDQIHQRAPSFKTEITYPFIVTGDLDSAELLKWKGRINRSQRALKRLFFKDDPSQVITVWLFKSLESYNQHNQKFWGMSPNTPYGYFIPASKRMVMNISSGGGTLTHELVHPYISQNIPKSPLWFHEGLATLYEQSRYSGGNIYGMNNWRLYALQQRIRSKTLPSLTSMMRSGQDFYGMNREIYYAQARYLMFYLQSRNLLVKYYDAYKDTAASDPSGIRILLDITQENSMAEFETTWKDFVLKQRF